jgi:hypothetical protein
MPFSEFLAAFAGAKDLLGIAEYLPIYTFTYSAETTANALDSQNTHSHTASLFIPNYKPKSPFYHIAAQFSCLYTICVFSPQYIEVAKPHSLKVREVTFSCGTLLV